MIDRFFPGAFCRLVDQGQAVDSRASSPIVGNLPWMLARSASMLLVGLTVIATTAPAHAEKRLTFCYDPYPPYTFGAEGAPTGGLKITLLQAVMDRIDGVSADVELLPWKRCQAQTKAGVIDGILPLFKNAERESYMEFTRGTFQETSRFWYSRAAFPDGLDWDGDPADLAHHALGMLNGGFINQAMQDAFEERQAILRARDVKSLMQLLLKGRVDLIATDEAVGRYHLVKNGWQDAIGAIDQPISQKSSYFGLSKVSGADKYVGEFNRIIGDLEATGVIGDILQSTDYPE